MPTNSIKELEGSRDVNSPHNKGDEMVPSFNEMVLELNDLGNVLIYESAQEGEWGVIKDSMFQFKVNSKYPSDEFLMFYIDQVSRA